MKKTSLLFTLFLLSASLVAQIPNPGFETWTNGNPDGWLTTNVPPLIANVSKSTNAHSGSAAAKGEAITFYTQVMTAAINCGTGFPISQRYSTVSGWYQLSSVGGDKFGVDLVMYKNGSPIAVGAAELPAASSYTKFNINIQYLTNDVPDMCAIIFAIVGQGTGSDLHAGSSFLLDDISLSGTVATSVEANTQPVEFALKQNYPNPFNPVTKIDYSVAGAGFVSLKVYDILGNVVSTLVNEVKPAGNYTAGFNGSGLPSGFYIYELKSGSQTLTRKMMLMK